jgi:hypothetical protein
MSNELLFASVDSLPPINKEIAAQEILKIDPAKSFWDYYRNVRIYPLMTKNASIGIEGSTNYQTGSFQWTSFAPSVIVEWCENHVFPWIGSKTRVVAFVTPPESHNNEHFDCDRTELNTRQHKLRVVLQGQSDSLYWLTENGTVNAPVTDKPFIIDGAWPHGVKNDSQQHKVVLALGSPWNGKHSYDDITIMQYKTEFVMPKEIVHLWEKL